MNTTCGYPPAEEFKVIRDVNAAALDFLNVRYLLSPPGRASPAPKWSPVYSGGDGTVFENRQWLPRVFTPQTISLVRGPDGASVGANAMELFGGALSGIAGVTDWRSRAYVLGRETRDFANGEAEVTEYRESTNRISFRTRSSGEEVLLVASLVQDGGWSARDASGQAIEVSRANGPFLALRVPKGDRRILLKYRPPGMALGGGISLASLVAVGGWALIRSRQTAARP